MRPTAKFTPRRRGHTLRGTAALSAGLLAHALVAPNTHAAVGGCRSGPIVTLSNRNTLDLSTIVSDTATDVQQVSYTLHAPTGTSVTREVDTSVLATKDTFQFYADEPPRTYSAGTQVTTLTPQIPVAATTALVNAKGKVLSTASASGLSGQTLWMDVSG